MVMAQCHPNRKHRARGLCTPCYSAARRALIKEAAKVKMTRMAGCHPDRPHCARGLCQSCYSQVRYETLREY